MTKGNERLTVSQLRDRLSEFVSRLSKLRPEAPAAVRCGGDDIKQAVDIGRLELRSWPDPCPAGCMTLYVANTKLRV